MDARLITPGMTEENERIDLETGAGSIVIGNFFHHAFG
jgi:hypothetical protein